MSESKSARQREKTMTELSGATREFARQGVYFAKDMTERTKATAEETSKGGGRGIFHVRQRGSRVRSPVDRDGPSEYQRYARFVHQVLGVKTPSAFVELSTEHARKQMEALAEQTGISPGWRKN